MTKPLEGIKVVEAAFWAFVPAAGGILSDLGASVTKIEPPDGDPIRGLTTGGSKIEHGFALSWDNYNRGKRTITIDLRQEAGVEILYKLIADADVFLTNLLPRSRRKMKIDIEDLRAINPNLIYAIGSGAGRRGPDADKGGFDNITFWQRSGIASALMSEDDLYPPSMPSGAFGDTASGAMLASGVCAAIAKRAMTGETSVVDASLLNTAMWSMQRAITQAAATGVAKLGKSNRMTTPNVLTNPYLTADKRIVTLCMLQGQRYWPGLCEAIGRPDMATDPRFATEEARKQNVTICVEELDKAFAKRPLAEWREILGAQDGQWDVVQHVGELPQDPQVVANEFMQDVDYGDGRSLRMVSVPMQFDGKALPARPAPAFAAHNEEILAELGYSEEEVINLKIANVVF